MIKGRKILVTGGAGFIGSHLVEALAAHNSVLVLDNLHTGIVNNLEGIQGDVKLRVLDTEDIFEVDFTPDVIFHLGMYSSTPLYRENRNLVHKVVDGTMKVMEFARKAGSRVVVASSSSIYNGHPTPQREDMIPMVTDFYTEARYFAERIGELYANMFGMKVSCLRFFSIYGPRERSKGPYANLISQFIWDLQAGRSPVIYGDGSQTRDFVFVKDVVDACQKAAESPSTGTFNVGTGKSYSINEMLEKVTSRLGVRVAPTYVPNPLNNYVMRTLADTSKAKKELGFEASYSLDDGLDLMLGSGRAIEKDAAKTK